MEKVYLSWDEYFMGIAVFTSLRSKDPSSKVGAVIVNEKNRIVGTGYNGFVAGIDESAFSWEREGEWLHTKYPYVVHAEANAILNDLYQSLSGIRSGFDSRPTHLITWKQRGMHVDIRWKGGFSTWKKRCFHVDST